MSGVATAIGVGVAGVGASIYGANKAAGAQEKASNAAVGEQRRQYDQSRADQAPWLLHGGNALKRLASASIGDLSGFERSPDYNFVRAEGQRDIGNSFAARGGAFGGNALRALDQYNTGLASQEYGNWWNRQAGLAGVGQSAANNIGQFGANAATNSGNALLSGGDARASGIIGATNALTGGISNAIDTWQYFRKPKMGSSMANNYTGSRYGGYA